MELELSKSPVQMLAHKPQNNVGHCCGPQPFIRLGTDAYLTSPLTIASRWKEEDLSWEKDPNPSSCVKLNSNWPSMQGDS